MLLAEFPQGAFLLPFIFGNNIPKLARGYAVVLFEKLAEILDVVKSRLLTHLKNSVKSAHK